MSNAASTETAHGGHPCTNPLCVSGVVYGDDESGECGSCGGSGVLRCACEGAPATVTTTDPSGNPIVCCVKCDEMDRIFRRVTAPDMAACEAMVALASGKAGR